jgi:hypothetical protein
MIKKAKKLKLAVFSYKAWISPDGRMYRIPDKGDGKEHAVAIQRIKHPSLKRPEVSKALKDFIDSGWNYWNELITALTNVGWVRCTISNEIIALHFGNWEDKVMFDMVDSILESELRMPKTPITIDTTAGGYVSISGKDVITAGSLWNAIKRYFGEPIEGKPTKIKSPSLLQQYHGSVSKNVTKRAKKATKKAH